MARKKNEAIGKAVSKYGETMKTASRPDFVAAMLFLMAAREELQKEGKDIDTGNTLENVLAVVEEARKRGAKTFDDFIKALTDGAILKELSQKSIKRIKETVTASAAAVEYIKMPNNTLSHVMARGAANVGDVSLLTIGVNPSTGNNAEIKYVIVPRGNDGATVTKQQAFYDSCVEAAWCAVWATYQKPVKISIYNAYAVFTGQSERARRTSDGKGAAKYQRFTESCTRLVNDELWINMTKETRQGKKKILHFPNRVSLVDSRDIRTNKQGIVETVITDYVLTEKPALLDYSESHGQIISKEKSFFEIYGKDGKLKQATESTTLIKYYLLRRVYDITSGADNKFISWKAMLEMIGAGDAVPSQKSRLTSFAILVLDNWKDRGLLAGYKHTKNGVEILPAIS